MNFQSVKELLPRLWPLTALSALVVVAAVIGDQGSGSFRTTVHLMLVDTIVVVGIYIFVGNSGVLSFGHISFMAIGAYVFALTTIPTLVKQGLISTAPHFILAAHLAILPAILLSGAIAAAFALLTSTALMRLSGLAAGISTLALLVIVEVVISNANSITGGTNTLVGVPIAGGLYGTVVWLVLALIVAFVFQQSRIGLRLRASREDEHAARSVGISVVRERRIAFVTSAFFVGIGGALYAHALGSISADAFYFQTTFITLVMLVVGGIGSLTGAVIGTVCVTVISEVLRHIEAGDHVGPLHISPRPGLREVGLSVVLLLILILRPRGISGSRELTWPFKIRSPRRDEPLPDPAPVSQPIPGAVPTHDDEATSSTLALPSVEVTRD